MQKRLILSAFVWVLAGCGQKTEIDSVGTAQGLKYTVISKTVALADGYTDLVIEVKVEDFLGHIMPEKTPPVSYAKNSGINHASCTPASPSGVSTCRLRSTLDGSVELSIGPLTKTEITFAPVSIMTNTLFGIVPSVQYNQDVPLGKIHSSVGNIVDKPKQRPSNWIVYTDSVIRQ